MLFSSTILESLFAVSDGLVDQNDPDCTSNLTQITILSPADGSTLISPPTFSWGADGGANNAFAIDLSLDPAFSSYWSSYENKGKIIFDTSVIMPSGLWAGVPSGKNIYWRIRGADLAEAPLTIINSNEVWSFYKP